MSQRPWHKVVSNNLSELAALLSMKVKTGTVCAQRAEGVGHTVLPAMVHTLKHVHAAAALCHRCSFVPAHLRKYFSQEATLLHVAPHKHGQALYCTLHQMWSKIVRGPRRSGIHIMEGAQLVVLASNHHVIDISNGARKVVARIGRLPGMPNHLRGAKPG